MVEKKPNTIKTVSSGSINWPLDSDGNPMVQVSYAAHQLINLGNYSNTTVGPVVVTKFVPENDTEGGLNDCVERVDQIVDRECAAIIEQIQEQAASR